MKETVAFSQELLHAALFSLHDTPGRWYSLSGDKEDTGSFSNLLMMNNPELTNFLLFVGWYEIHGKKIQFQYDQVKATNTF